MSIVTYIRNLLRWTDIPQGPTKRSRLDEESSEILSPSHHRLSLTQSPKRQKISELNEQHDGVTFSRVRLSRGRGEASQPSTSTPQLVNNGRTLTSIDAMDRTSHSISHNNEVDDEVQIVGVTPATKNVLPKYIIPLDDDDEIEEDDDDDDVIYLNTQPKALSPNYSTFDRSLKRRNVPILVESPRSRALSRTLKGAGITKSYRRGKVCPLPKWMKENINKDGESSANPGIYNLTEKQWYQDLIANQIDRIGVRATKGINGLMGKGTLHEKNSRRPASKDSDIQYLGTTTLAITEPVNTLKDSFKNISITKDNWLSEIDKKYEAKKKDILSNNLEITQETVSVLEKLRKENSAIILENDLKQSLELPSALIASPSEAGPLLPPLTEEHEQIIHRVTAKGYAVEVITEKFNLKITRRDIQTLCGLTWLNDVIVNYYMNLIMQRSADNPNLPKTYTTNTFFYERLLNSGHNGLKRWTKKVDIFSYDIMAIPIHLGVHWTMCLIYFNKKQIQYLDSMNGSNDTCLNAVMQYLKDEHMQKKGTPLDDNGWTMENCKKIPQQMNGSDCGVFAMTFAEFASRAQPFNFTQAHMPYFRKKAIVEIQQGKLIL